MAILEKSWANSTGGRSSCFALASPSEMKGCADPRFGQNSFPCVAKYKNSSDDRVGLAQRQIVFLMHDHLPVAYHVSPQFAPIALRTIPVLSKSKYSICPSGPLALYAT